MPLSWSQQEEISAALSKAYPEADRLSLDHGQLLQLIQALPDFHDASAPPASTYLDHILWTWMRFAGDHSEGGRA